MPRLKALVFTCLLGFLPVAWAQAEPSAADQRKEARALIAKDRKAIEDRLAANEKTCYQHFAVNDCLKKVRGQYNAEERALSKRDLAINAEERAERTAKQRAARERKQGDFERKHPPLDGGSVNRPDLEQRQREHNAQAAQRAHDPKRTPESIAAEQQKREQEAVHRAASQNGKVASKQRSQERRRAELGGTVSQAQSTYDAKQAEAERRVQAHDRRVKEQEGKRKAAPLPVPE